MPRNRSQRLRFLNILFFLLFIFTYSLQLTAYRLFAQDEFIYDSKGKRDPFIPLITPDGRFLKLEKEEGTLGLLIEGIIYDKSGLSYAIVNGEVVKIGDKINNYSVLKIEKNRVIFIKDGQPIEVELKKGEE